MNEMNKSQNSGIRTILQKHPVVMKSSSSSSFTKPQPHIGLTRVIYASMKHKEYIAPVAFSK